jgi:malate permease and related proteins
MIFSLLLLKIIPFYLIILLGYLAGKLFNTNRDALSQILFFLITPVIIFNGVINTDLNFSILSLPFLTFTISSSICLLFYALSRFIWQDSTKNLMAMSAGGGNTGYFGLPMALLLFNEQGAGVYIIALLGVTIYENSVGYYILAKGTHTAMECIRKLIKLPSLYAVLFGLIAHLFHIRLPSIFEESIIHMKGAYTVLGMMIIGLGLAGLPNFKFDFKFIGMTFLAKFAVWPLLVLLLIAVDMTWLHFFNQVIYDALILLSIVPIGVNTVILSSLLKNQPEKAVIAVVLSTVFALAYMPLMTTYFIEGSKGNSSMEESVIAEVSPPEKN